MRYRILGVTQTEDDQGVAVPVPGARLRALLTALALRPGRLTAPETLIDEVWPEAPPQDAPAALQALIGRLRRAVGKDAVTSAPGGYRLAATEDDVDLFVFERLVRLGVEALRQGDASAAAGSLDDALALWRGRALADLPDRTPAARPEALRLEASRARLEADLLLGRAREAVPRLTELTAAHPYDEPLHALLIRALRDSGRAADALAAYETARRTLADGLGADPGPQLRALHAGLLNLDDREPAHGSNGSSGAEPGRGPEPGGGPEPRHDLHPGPRPEPAFRPESAARPGPAPSPQSPGSPLPGGPEGAPGPGAGRDRPRGPHSPLPPGLPERTGNLRPRLTSFVGREPEIAAIRSDLHRARLVTLTGPGGSGKTRLAEEAAAGLPQAWLAELAPLDRPEAVPGAVVSALGLRETVLMTTELAPAQDDPVALLVEYCAPRSHLLILDNCEHVIGAAADLAETLLTRCPGLTILATSREPLGVPGEAVRPVEPLLPDHAHRLFTERAAAVRPDAATALRNEEAIAEICRRLDGLPLAIELAAARLRLLTPRQIADRLDDRFRLLTSGSRTVLPRQQTLRAVVDWSWDLLDEPERTLLRELSVFAGGWDLEAAEAVCTGPVAELVGALVDKSLVVAAPHAVQAGDGMRYRMLETIHEYALERAAEQPRSRAATERRHRAWVRALVERADPLLRSAEQLSWIARLETELDNIRVGLDRSLTAGDEEEAAAVCLAAGWFWWLRNYRHEGAEWTDRTLRLGAVLDSLQPPGTRTSTARETEASAIAPGLPADLAARMAAVDPVGIFLAEPDSAPDAELDAVPGGEGAARGAGGGVRPRSAQRTNLRMLHLFLLSESEPTDTSTDPRYPEYLARLRARYEPGGPQAARMPGLIWPVTAFQMRDTVDVREILDRAVENCRLYGGDWELGCALMFRTHMVVDSPGGLHGVDDDLAELRVLSLRVGDRWMRAQVCGAAAEVGMARSRFTEAEQEYREALRLAYEVGAYAETPFLIARLAEIAYRSGDVDGALATLDEASGAADRYGVPDVRAFVLLLRAHIALYVEEDSAHARVLCDEGRAAAGAGTPPPQFAAALSMLDAELAAVEAGPRHALPMLADTLRQAMADQCAEAVTSSIVDDAAVLLVRLGDFPRAARLLAAADALRDPHPRPMPQKARAEHAEAAVRGALGAERYAAERARASRMTSGDALHEITEAVHDHPVPSAGLPDTPSADPAENPGDAGDTAGAPASTSR
ncbi:BTAD domain-containing putative transcriptional regulator [Streptomyces sp. Root264]|uniref:AfsR/SARP family transcriptional regulator n=1 Tax=Streptomyces sp. Root264 TaxID=1736503 RepID=UPI00070C4C90|nr:BTAD domain-containing putative transcriptional regulator [Streptomyces sp. Root264]KRD21109.1 AfsR family transcriptional regulator [Streptomyces sp. Root264]